MARITYRTELKYTRTKVHGQDVRITALQLAENSYAALLFGLFSRVADLQWTLATKQRGEKSQVVEIRDVMDGTRALIQITERKLLT